MSRSTEYSTSRLDYWTGDPSTQQSAVPGTRVSEGRVNCYYSAVQLLDHRVQAGRHLGAGTGEPATPDPQHLPVGRHQISLRHPHRLELPLDVAHRIVRYGKWKLLRLGEPSHPLAVALVHAH